MSLKITFTQPIAHIYLVLIDNKITVAMIIVSTNNMILDIEINNYYFHSLKNNLMTDFLKEIGSDIVYARVDNRYKEYFNELGFESFSKHIDNSDYDVMKYEL